MPTVSVVIPLYNGRDVMRNTIRSMLAQTWKDYVIVVIEDGSTDGCGDLVQALGPALRHIRRKNGGVARLMRGTCSRSSPS
jgi:glycosyltransferase involved in cell wall biosynthesis